MCSFAPELFLQKFRVAVGAERTVDTVGVNKPEVAFDSATSAVQYRRCSRSVCPIPVKNY